MTAERIPVLPERDLSQPGASSPSRLSVAEYLALERLSEIRHEYVDGVLINMAGGSPNHDRIVGATFVAFDNALGARRCEPFTANMRVRVSPSQYRYPDISVVCVKHDFDDEIPPSLLTPTVIIEVVSPSTAQSDREDKFAVYKQITSLVDYLLIEQDRVEITHYHRISLVQWVVTIHNSLESTLTLESVGVALVVKDLYRRTELTAGSESAAAPDAP